MNRRLWFVVGVLFLICTMISCRKEETIQTSLYEISEFDPFKDLAGTYTIEKTAYYNQNMYLVCANYNEQNQEYVYSLYKTDGKQTQEIEKDIKFQNSESEWIDIDVASNGDVFAYLDSYSDEDVEYHLVVWDANTNQHTEIKLDYTSLKDDYVSNIMAGFKEQVLLFSESGKIYVFDDKGQFLYDVLDFEGKQFVDFAYSNNGDIVFVVSGNHGEKEQLQIYEWAESEKSPSLFMELNPEKYDQEIIANGVGDAKLFLRDNQYIYSVSKDGEQTPVVKWEECNITNSSCFDMYAVSEQEFYAVGATDNALLYKLNKLDLNNQKEKEILHVAALEHDSQLEKQIALFNKENERYHVELVDYSNKEEAKSTFLMDIATNKEIDIILLPPGVKESICSKGVLEDLYPYIDSDPSLKREDFLTNILGSYEYNGKLYHTVSNFNLVGTIHKKSCKKEEILKMGMQQSSACLYPDSEATSLLRKLLNEKMNQFIDYEQKKCDFENQDFYNALKLAKLYSQKEAIIEEECLSELKQENLYFIQTMISPIEIEILSDYFGNDYEVVESSISMNEGGYIDSQDVMFGISCQSSNKEGAWQFVRTYMTYGYQKSIEKNIAELTFMIPVRKDCFEEYMKRFTAKDSYEQNGSIIKSLEGSYITDYFAIDDLKPLNAEQEKQFRLLIDASDKRDYYDEQVDDIILEEVMSYFNGEKTEDEIAHIIQNRVSIYLSE